MFDMKEKYPTFELTKSHYRTINSNVVVSGVFDVSIKKIQALFEEI